MISGTIPYRLIEVSMKLKHLLDRIFQNPKEEQARRFRLSAWASGEKPKKLKRKK